MRRVARMVREREQVHLVPIPDGTQLVKCANLIAFVGGIRNAVAKVQNSQRRPLESSVVNSHLSALISMESTESLSAPEF
jgi:hypothetical protein